jgi:hypothetical protein
MIRARRIEFRAADRAARRERAHALAALGADMGAALAHGSILAQVG